MKTIRMVRKDVQQIVDEMLKGDEPCICDSLEVLDALLEREHEFVIETDFGTHAFTKEKMKRLRSLIGFDPRGYKIKGDKA